MYIHWFPGHMTKAIRMMEKEMSLVDSVIYVLDSRAPLSSLNPSFDTIIGIKPILYVLNKADTVPMADLKKWQKHFTENGKRCIITNSISKADAKAIIQNLVELNRPLIERFLKRGIKKTIRAMVIGVPNCGKSTLINSLIPHKKAMTGNKPGVTRGKQWISIDTYIDLLDSPGVLYPDFSDQNKAINLAMIGSIKEDILDITELSIELLNFLTRNYKNELMAKYKLDEINPDVFVVMQEIGKKRGFILKGGEIDMDKTAKGIIVDFRRQAFSKIILEKVDDLSKL